MTSCRARGRRGGRGARGDLVPATSTKGASEGSGRRPAATSTSTSSCPEARDPTGPRPRSACARSCGRTVHGERRRPTTAVGGPRRVRACAGVVVEHVADAQAGQAKSLVSDPTTTVAASPRVQVPGCEWVEGLVPHRGALVRTARRPVGLCGFDRQRPAGGHDAPEVPRVEGEFGVVDPADGQLGATSAMASAPPLVSTSPCWVDADGLGQRVRGARRIRIAVTASDAACDERRDVGCDRVQALSTGRGRRRRRHRARLRGARRHRRAGPAQGRRVTHGRSPSSAIGAGEVADGRHREHGDEQRLDVVGEADGRVDVGRDRARPRAELRSVLVTHRRSAADRRARHRARRRRPPRRRRRSGDGWAGRRPGLTRRRRAGRGGRRGAHERGASPGPARMAASSSRGRCPAEALVGARCGGRPWRPSC